MICLDMYTYIYITDCKLLNLDKRVLYMFLIFFLVDESTEFDSVIYIYMYIEEKRDRLCGFKCVCALG